MLTFTQTGLLSALCLSQIRWYNKRKHWRAPPGGPQQKSEEISETWREKPSIVEQKWANCTGGIYSIFMMTSEGELDRAFMHVCLGRPESSLDRAATFHNCRCCTGLLQIQLLQKANKSSIMLLCAAGQSTRNR